MATVTSNLYEAFDVVSSKKQLHIDGQPKGKSGFELETTVGKAYMGAGEQTRIYKLTQPNTEGRLLGMIQYNIFMALPVMFLAYVAGWAMGLYQMPAWLWAIVTHIF